MQIMDGTPRGRLYRLDGRSGALELVMCGLHFANGVQLLPPSKKGGTGGPRLLVCESTRFRILSLDLAAYRALSHEGRRPALEVSQGGELPAFLISCNTVCCRLIGCGVID